MIWLHMLLTDPTMVAMIVLGAFYMGVLVGLSVEEIW